jgi:deoxyribonuclease-4
MFGYNIQVTSKLLYNSVHLAPADCHVCQFFIGSPKSPYVSELPDLDCNKLVVEGEKFFLVHGHYIYNLSDTEKSPGYINSILAELRQAAKVGADVIIHMGKACKRTRAVAIANYIRGVCEILERHPYSNKLLLENAAGQGTELGFSLDEFALIFNSIPEELRIKVGICFDTCHGFAGGMCDLRTADTTAAFLQSFHDKIGLENIRAVHLNDSVEDYSMHLDRHADIRHGAIWSGPSGKEALGYFIRSIAGLGVPMVFESDLSLHTFTELRDDAIKMMETY